MNRYFWRWDPRNCSAVIRLNYSKFCAKLMWYFTNCLWLLFNPSDSPLPSQRLPLQWSYVFKVFETDRPSMFLCLKYCLSFFAPLIFYVSMDTSESRWMKWVIRLWNQVLNTTWRFSVYNLKVCSFVNETSRDGYNIDDMLSNTVLVT